MSLHTYSTKCIYSVYVCVYPILRNWYNIYIYMYIIDFTD